MIMKTEWQNDGWLWATSIHNMEEKLFFFVFSVMTTEYGAVMEMIYNWKSN